MTKKVMVGGACGMIGANFCRWLIANTDYDVIGIDNLSGGSIENVPNDNIRFYLIDYDLSKNDGYLQTLFIRYKPFVFYAFNAYASEGRSNYIRTFITKNNTVSICNIVNSCVNNNCKLIFTSSVAVYSGQPPFSEETIPNPIDEYGLSKLTSEKTIQIAGEEQGLDWCIIRPRNVYGIYQNLFDKTRNLFGIWMYNALNGLSLEIFGDGSNKRSFTYVDDILEPLHNAIKYDRQIINVGSEKVYSIGEAAKIFSEVTGYSNIKNVDERKEVKEAFCLIEKSKQLLDFKDETTLYAGLKKMWVWAKEQPMKPLQTPPQLEVYKTHHSSIV